MVHSRNVLPQLRGIPRLTKPREVSPPGLERSPTVAHVRDPAFEAYAGGIEAEVVNVRVSSESFAPQSLTGAPNAFTLGSVDAAKAGSQRRLGPCPHFDYYDRPAVNGDDIELQASEAEIAARDAIPELLEVMSDGDLRSSGSVERFEAV